MGEGLINLYNTKIKKEWKIAFISTFVVGLLTHIYKFTNTLPNHDSLYNFYSDQNIMGSGRWFLSIACGFSSYYDLPWVNGLLSIIFIALTAAVVVDIFKIKNRVMILLTGGLLATFPAITETFDFEFTADGYMLAMFMAALAVRLSLIGDKKKSHVLISSILICLSCGIYQAYVSFALVLAMCYFICEILENKYSNKELFGWIGKQAIIYITALASYYIIWQACMKVFGYTATPHMGIDRIGKSFDIKVFLNSIYLVIAQFVKHFFNIDNGVSINLVVSVIFAVVLIFIGIVALKKSGINKTQIGLVFIVLAAIPFAAFIWQLPAEWAIYAPRMKQSLCILYIFAGVLCCRWAKPKFSNVTALLLSLVVFLNFINANIYYYQMDKNYERAYAAAVEMSTRIHMADDGDVKRIAIIGKSDDSDFEKLQPHCGDVLYLMQKKEWVSLYLSNIVDFRLEYYEENKDAEMPVVEMRKGAGISNTYEFRFPLADNETKKQLEESSEVAEMGCWPASDSVKKIGDTIVVKLSEPVEEEQ